MYGNFCGPYWSDGKWQESVEPTIPAVDELDEVCREHDMAYFRGYDLLDADVLFTKHALRQGPTGMAMAVPVFLQASLRAIDILPRITNKHQTHEEMAKQGNLRGTTKQSKTSGAANVATKQAKRAAAAKAMFKSRNQQNQTAGMQMQMSTPPVSYGTSIRPSYTVTERSLDKARLIGRDFIGTVEGNGITTFGLGKSALLSPAYFQSTVLGNLARSFERYRWNRLRVHYVPKVSTAVTGQVIMCSQRSVSEPGLQPESGAFLPRAMSQGNASFGPLWAPNYIDIDCSGEFKLVDPAIHADLDDAIHEELQVYTQVSVQQQVGYLFAEYDISFTEPIFQPHSTILPIPTGPGVRVALAEQNAVNGINEDWRLADNSGTLDLTNAANGSVYRLVFDLQGSTFATGGTFATGLNVLATYRDTFTTQANATTILPLVGGVTLYAVVTGSNFSLYTSVEAAITGNGSGQIFHQVATTVRGTYIFDAQLVRYGVARLPVVQ